MTRVSQPAPDICRLELVTVESAGRRPRESRSEAVNQLRGAADRPTERATRDSSDRHLPGERRLLETPGTSFGINGGADVSVGHMDPLPARGADERVIVQRRNGSSSAFFRQPRQIERQVQQVVNVQHVGRGGIEHMPKLRV